jgi:hypothetical protein
MTLATEKLGNANRISNRINGENRSQRSHLPLWRQNLLIDESETAEWERPDSERAKEGRWRFHLGNPARGDLTPQSHHQNTRGPSARPGIHP